MTDDTKAKLRQADMFMLYPFFETAGGGRRVRGGDDGSVDGPRRGYVLLAIAVFLLDAVSGHRIVVEI